MDSVATVPGKIRDFFRSSSALRRYRRRSVFGVTGLRGCLERPSSGEQVAERIDLSGWAFSLDGRALSGELTCNGLGVMPLEFQIERPDVAQAYLLAPSQSRVGFSNQIPWSRLGVSENSANIGVEITNGRDRISFGPISISRTMMPVSKALRAKYKDVWQDVSQDHQRAMLAVAGTDDFSHFMEMGVSTAETLRQILEIKASDTVLEIGCGTGRIGKALAPQCKLWIGTDISANMLHYARENLQGISNYELKELDSCSLREIPSSSIDKIYCSVVFMHLDEWDRFRYVSEAYRVLKSGGRFYVDNVDLESDEGWKIFSEISKMDPAERPANVSKVSTKSELMTYLSRAGFTGIETVPSSSFLIAILGKKN